MEKNEAVKMLIRFYNVQAGTSFRISNDWNCKVVGNALDRCNGDVEQVKDSVRTWVREHPDEATDNLTDCFETIYSKVPVPEGEKTVEYGMGLLEKTVIDMIATMQSEKIEKEVMWKVEGMVRDFIKKEYGTIERKITTVIDGKEFQMDGVVHEKFETIMKFVANKRPVYLYGPAGSGKNVICKQIAKSLGLDFYFTNAVTQEYKLTGFTDAMGNYQPTQFYKAFTQGGVFMLDEMDASIPETLIILNAAIANKYFDFPAPIGYVEAHPDFRVIAAGNTIGHGADFEYVGRSPLDASTLDRFAAVKIDYSREIENKMSNGDNELLKFCREIRKSAEKQGIKLIVSYRTIDRLAQMSQIMSLEETLETSLIKGLEKDDINIICNGVKSNSRWKTALENVVRGM